MEALRSIDYSGMKDRFRDNVKDTVSRLGSAWNEKSKGSKAMILIAVLVFIAYVAWVIYRKQKTNVFYYEKGRTGYPSSDPTKDDVIEDSALPRAEYTVEFTYDFFMYVTNWTEGMNWFRTILCKSVDNITFCPLIYLDPFINDLGVVITCVPEKPELHGTSVNTVIKVPDFPLKRWTHVAVCVHNVNVEVYINGLLAKSVTMLGPAKENMGDLKVCPWEGYNGFMSKLHYVSKQLTAREVYELSRRPVIKYGIFGVSVPNSEVCGGRTDLFTIPVDADYTNIDATSLAVYSNVPDSIGHIRNIDEGLYTYLSNRMTTARSGNVENNRSTCPESADNAPVCPTGTLACSNPTYQNKYCYYPEGDMMVQTYMDVAKHKCPALGTGNGTVKPKKIGNTFVWRTQFGKDTANCPNVRL